MRSGRGQRRERLELERTDTALRHRLSRALSLPSVSFSSPVLGRWILLSLFRRRRFQTRYTTQDTNSSRRHAATSLSLVGFSANRHSLSPRPFFAIGS